MTWFRYLPSNASPSQTTQDKNYKYPILKREIKIPEFRKTVPANAWIFVDVSDLKIDDYIDDELLTQTEQNSYLVVYESFSADDYNFTPVKTQIINNILFFKTAENHDKDSETQKQYSLYYKTDYLKSIKKVQNGQYEDFIACSESEAEFITTQAEVDKTFFDVYPSTDEVYSFSFANINVDWENGLSLTPGAKAIGTFTGPFFELYCNKGSNYGKFQIRIISLSDDATPVSYIEQDWISVDLFNPTEQQNQLVFSKNNLFYKNYIFEIVSNFEKNDLSSNGQVKISYYSYGYDAKCKLGSEQVSPYLVGKRILGGSVNG